MCVDTEKKQASSQQSKAMCIEVLLRVSIWTCRFMCVCVCVLSMRGGLDCYSFCHKAVQVCQRDAGKRALRRTQRGDDRTGG